MVGYQICTKITASSFIISENVAKISVNMRGEDNTVNCKTSLPIYSWEDVTVSLYTKSSCLFFCLYAWSDTMPAISYICK
jgi:hypothetical protein